MPLISFGSCDIGRKRKSNQDSIYLDSTKNIFIVADGMGGHNAGDVASKMAIEYVTEFLKQTPELATMEPADIHSKLRKAILQANDKIHTHSKSDASFEGMGTTLSVLLFCGPHLYIGNVGDSRAYLCNQGKIFQLSRDHSLIQEKLNIGLYGREQAINDPQKNVLVRAVGFDAKLEADTYSYKIHRNDIFLCCSDGLYGRVGDKGMLRIINTGIPEPSTCRPGDVEQTVKRLVEQANECGGGDNISCILIVAR